MNIAIIIKKVFDPEAGGVQRVTDNLYQIFSIFKHNIIIICYDAGDQLQPVTEKSILNVKNEVQLKHVLQDHDTNIIINQEGYALKFTKLLLQNKNPETLLINNLHINPLNFYDNYKDFIRGFFKRHKLSFLNNSISMRLILLYHIAKQRKEFNYIIKKTDAFIMLSEHFKSELYFLAPSLKKQDHKIHGIGNPFERPAIDISRLEKENIILFVGRLNILQKRVDLLLQIWKKLHEECPDWRFWVVGDGESKTFMENFCKEHQLDRVTFFGKDNPNDYYKKAKIFHMTSAFEGFGNVLVEAQSYGCVPVLFNTYAAAEDIVTQNENGILVKPLNVEGYVKQTMLLINNPSNINKLATNAYENVLRFSYGETYKKWDAVFKCINSQGKK
jgi:glycosyltransferase involved in cell wall biosynthesis